VYVARSGPPPLAGVSVRRSTNAAVLEKPEIEWLRQSSRVNADDEIHEAGIEARLPRRHAADGDVGRIRATDADRHHRHANLAAQRVEVRRVRSRAVGQHDQAGEPALRQPGHRRDEIGLKVAAVGRRRHRDVVRIVQAVAEEPRLDFPSAASDGWSCREIAPARSRREPARIA
jgi:hypothetical protein